MWRRRGLHAKGRLRLAEYEEVRSHDDRFAVHPRHERAKLECVVKRNDRFVLVDKIDAVKAIVADDPRGHASS